MEQIYVIELFIEKYKIEVFNEKRYESLAQKEDGRRMTNESTINILCENLFDFTLVPKGYTTMPENTRLKYICSDNSSCNCLSKKPKNRDCSIRNQKYDENGERSNYAYAIYSSIPRYMIEAIKANPIELYAEDNEKKYIGEAIVEWDQQFLTILRRSAKLHPIDNNGVTFRSKTKLQETFKIKATLDCEDSLHVSGYVNLVVNLKCLGVKVMTSCVPISESDEKTKENPEENEGKKAGDQEVDTEIATNKRKKKGGFLSCWEKKNNESISEERDDQKLNKANEPVIVIPFTKRERIVISMRFPKGPCGATNCMDRLCGKPEKEVFVSGFFDGATYIPGGFVNVRDVHGPCGRLECPLAKKVRHYILEKQKEHNATLEQITKRNSDCL